MLCRVREHCCYLPTKRQSCRTVYTYCPCYTQHGADAMPLQWHRLLVNSINAGPFYGGFSGIKKNPKAPRCGQRRLVWCYSALSPKQPAAGMAGASIISRAICRLVSVSWLPLSMRAIASTRSGWLRVFIAVTILPWGWAAYL